MTALSEFERFEAPGVWRPSPDAQRRDVVVSLGKATITLTDLADRPLAHWSLPALTRVNPGQLPAVFSPGRESAETLEIDDPEMLNAIARVERAIDRGTPRPGRLRIVSLSLIFLAVAGLVAFWLPGALARYTASILPAAAAAAIGEDLKAHLFRLTGPPCRTRAAERALADLTDRLGDVGTSHSVVPGGLAGALALPGGEVLIGRGLVEDHETPEVLAAELVAVAVGREIEDPALRLLLDAGLPTSIALLTTGRIEDGALAAHAETLLATPSPLPQTGMLLARLEAAGVPARPLALAMDPTGESTLDLIEADPVPAGAALPLMTDDAWVALQQVCTREN